jgi:N6-adenosine-specific RNA methylase IME4
MEITDVQGLTPWASISKSIDLARDLRDLERIKSQIEKKSKLDKLRYGSREVANKAAMYKIELDAKRGEWLGDNIKHGGRDHPVTLKDAGVGKKEAQRARAVAKVPKDVRDKYYDKCLSNGEMITQAGVIALGYVPKTSTPPMPDGKYSVILADPPWKYRRTPSRVKPPEHHYPTMDLQDICNLAVKNLAADNCTLVLWVPPCHLDHGLTVLKAWGFEYKTCLVWDKGGKNMGQYSNLTHEMILIGGRGSSTPSVADKAVVQSIDSILSSPKTKKHSEKPSLLYEVIEALWPDGKYIELFARSQHSSRWAVWGNQAPKTVLKLVRRVSAKSHTRSAMLRETTPPAA